MIRRSTNRSGALGALLLFLLLGACGPASGETNAGDRSSKDPAPPATTVAATETVPEASVPEGKAPEAKAEPETEAPPQSAGARSTKATAFLHRAAGGNVANNSTYLDDPEINGDPEAVLLVTRESGVDIKHPIGVWYDRYRDGGRWAIFNQDLAPMADGSSFEVAVFKTPATVGRDAGGPETGGHTGETAFVHEAAPPNLAGDSTYLDDPLLNGDPDTTPSVTQSWNPGGGDGVYNDHRVGVRYDAARDKWTVFNEDRSVMSEDVAFNVSVSEGGGEASPSGAVPEFRDFFSEGDPRTPAKFISSGSSAGTIPAVKPFNFGRDPGGPEDKTLYLTIPRLGIEGVPVFDTVSEEKLREGTVHIPATGYPWQDGANVFIAGHRIGYANTRSYYVFYRLDELGEGDEILLEDSAGGRYVYRVSRKTVVGPDSVEVMNAREGESLVTLQTCTLPDYEERLIVQGELVEKDD